MREYYIVVGSRSFFDNFLSTFSGEKDSFLDLVRVNDAQQKQGWNLCRQSDSLVVRNSDYHGIVSTAHDRLGELIESFTTDEAKIYIHNPPALLKRYLQVQKDINLIKLAVISEKYEIERDPSAFVVAIDKIRKKLIGQESAVRDISKSIWYLTNVDRRKPYVIMLYGNSSLGKTELVREISRYFFKSKYMEKHLSMFKNANYAEYFFGNEPNRSSIGFDLLARE